eukprot:TRINITY_DN11752_c0_g1_i1.p1 TRINITY_DN11752_c0_g1~~TRINITY_DN11752_c0_g1_i1.p1  ORF type:complete len:302 (-),score=41.18 TRINITY_DN11752_c0_g1_i1:39-944(-)
MGAFEHINIRNWSHLSISHMNLRTRFCLFEVFDRETTSSLRSVNSTSEAREILKTKLEDVYQHLQNNFDGDLQLMEIFLDYMFNSLKFCQRQDFSDEKVSTMLEMSYELLFKVMKDRINYEGAFDHFKETLLRHSLFRPPHSIIVFTLSDVKDITDYFMATFFKHYPLYVKALTKTILMEITTQDMIQARFPILLDLNNGGPIDKMEIPLLAAYNTVKEVKLTDDELEDIMRGDSIQNINPKKRAAMLKAQREKELKERIERVMKYELDKLQQGYDEKIALQDKKFHEKLDALKRPGKRQT